MMRAFWGDDGDEALGFFEDETCEFEEFVGFAGNADGLDEG